MGPETRQDVGVTPHAGAAASQEPQGSPCVVEGGIESEAARATSAQTEEAPTPAESAPRQLPSFGWGDYLGRSARGRSGRSAARHDPGAGARG